MSQAQVPGGSDDEDLRRRLSEAEDTLRAIREGQVDAVVMRGDDAKDEVFALGSENSYRTFMEAMDIGAAALDASGKLIYANGALLDLLGSTLDQLQAGEFFDRFAPAEAIKLKRLIAEASDGRQSDQLSFATPSGDCFFEAAVAPLELAFGRGYALTLTDVTERVEAAAQSEGERIGRAVLASSNEAVVVCNEAGIITQANAKVRVLADESAIGKTFEDAFDLDFPVGAGLLGGGDLVDLALSGSGVRGVEATLKSGDQPRTLLINAGALRTSGQTIIGCIIGLADVTDQKAVERKQRLLMDELTHRVKNTLTLVLSIANRTAAGMNSLAEFKTAFGRRLEALAATHNLLADDFSKGLTIEEIVNAELAPYVAADSERLTIDGLHFRLNSDTAVTLGLVLHELVTNAVKYGALSNDTGRIVLTGRRDGARIEIVWREEGGPPVSPPAHKGFGTTLIARGLGQSGGSATQVDYAPDGVVCTMFVPQSGLAPAALA
ncbi:PAS domain-containing protein [Sphingomonas sabuli]|uniref:histidine kinase n=1 Tax=Sphingomonas sabuli TaxID=2764186 RepID=A0A7G9L246_9SPHN|nr:HWE histidine kinase domain-containing protein [Sphingomonas sabuli]QNM82695.1 PAS domain-containing protein [Sphingomonas sabuli]